MRVQSSHVVTAIFKQLQIPGEKKIDGLREDLNQ